MAYFVFDVDAHTYFIAGIRKGGIDIALKPTMIEFPPSDFTISVIPSLLLHLTTFSIMPIL